MAMLSKSILSETQQELLKDMTYKLETDTLREIERLANQMSTSVSLENMPLSILLRVALENLAEKHVVETSYKTFYNSLKRI